MAAFKSWKYCLTRLDFALLNEIKLMLEKILIPLVYYLHLGTISTSIQVQHCYCILVFKFIVMVEDTIPNCII